MYKPLGIENVLQLVTVPKELNPTFVDTFYAFVTVMFDLNPVKVFVDV